jgi:hypothetical protein
MTGRIVKATKPKRTQGAGGKPSKNLKKDPRRKSRKGHAKTRGGQPRSPSLR